MAVVYVLIARDPSLIVADAISDEIKIPRGAVQELRGSLGRLIGVDKQISETIDRFGLKLYLSKDRVLLGCVTQINCSDQKAKNTMLEAQKVLVQQYQGHIQILYKQNNLVAYGLNPFLQKKLKTIIDATNTGINQDALAATFAKVSSIKVVMSENIEKHKEGQEVTKSLLEESQEMAQLGSHFEKNSAALQRRIKRQDFWCFSCKCILMFGGIIIGLVVLYFILSWIFCDSGTLFTGC